jgi:hypothetical protein
MPRALFRLHQQYEVDEEILSTEFSGHALLTVNVNTSHNREGRVAFRAHG